MGLFSAITGIFGAAQSASAYSNAAGEQARGYVQSADTVDRSVQGVARNLRATAGDVGRHYEDAAEGAAQGVVNAGVDARSRGDQAAGQANQMLNPYIQAGGDAVTRLSALAGDGGKFTFSEDDPSYQFRLQEGQKALERNSAARGLSQSGGTMKALTRYAQGAASTEYGAAFDRFERSRTRNFSELSTLASGGLQASGRAGDNLTGAAQYGGNAVLNAEQSAGGFRTGGARYSGDATTRAGEVAGQLEMTGGAFRANAEQGIADSRASSYLGRANAWNGALSQIGSAADGFLAGGTARGAQAGGGGGFNWGDAFRGYTQPKAA